MKTYALALWTTVSVLAASAPAHAVLKTVAVQGDLAPNGAAYKRFRLPAIGDGPGERVAVFNPTQGSTKCAFRLDPDGGPGTVIACEKQPSPDGRLFSKIQDPLINVAGVPVFASRTTVGTDGIYRGVPTTVVALTNDPVGLLFLDDPASASITDTGDVVFLAALTGGAPDDAGIFRCSGGDGNCSPNTVPPGTGALTTLVRVGDAVPDRAGREFCSFLAARASGFGVAFTATTKLDCTNAVEVEAPGVFRLPIAGVIVTVALAGEATVIGPTTYSEFRTPPSIANTGSVGFQADLVGTPSSALFRCDVATCPAAPATDAVQLGEIDAEGNAFRFFSAPSVSDVGDLVFNARLAGGPAGISNGVYIWRSASDTFEAVARKNDPVPDIAGAIFVQFLLGPPSMSPGGKVAFKAKIKRSITPRVRIGIFVNE